MICEICSDTVKVLRNVVEDPEAKKWNIKKICMKCFEKGVKVAKRDAKYRNYVLIQEELRSGTTVAELIQKYQLEVSRSKRHPELVQFKYSIFSPIELPLVQQCRGLILNEADNWEVVARPFDKFFNFGEPHAANIDWASARVLEKLDGTCCILYCYKGWQVATLGSCDASGQVGKHSDVTFHDLFWRTFQDLRYVVPHDCWSGVTFIFELTTPMNRVVVPHTKSDLVLLGTRIATGEEASLQGVGYRTPKTLPFDSVDKINESFDTLDPLHNEGYVVVDAKYRRVKIKHPGYVRIHRIKDSFSLRNIVELIRNNEHSEFLTYFPEHKPVFEIVRKSFWDLMDRIYDTHLKSFDIKDRKEFAMKIKDLPFSSILFSLRDGSINNIPEGLRKMHIDRLISLLEVEEEVKREEKQQ